MKFDVNGHTAFASTGGRVHQPGNPNLVFVHGSGQSRLTWISNLARPPIAAITFWPSIFPGMATALEKRLQRLRRGPDWIINAMDAVGFKTATFIGHSQGCLNVLKSPAATPQNR